MEVRASDMVVSPAIVAVLLLLLLGENLNLNVLLGSNPFSRYSSS